MTAVLKYIKNNNWKTIKADWKEYQELRNRCKELKHYAFEASRTLCCNKEVYLRDNVPLKCIRVVTNDCFNPYDPDGVSGYWSSEYCPHFSEQDETVYCTQYDCPYVVCNRKYIDALKRYRHWKQVKESFWNTKMMRTK